MDYYTITPGNKAVFMNVLPAMTIPRLRGEQPLIIIKPAQDADDQPPEEETPQTFD